MSKRRCPGCPTLVAKGVGRCPACKAKADEARGRRQQRGYDAEYDRERRHYERAMARGEVFTCWRCEELGSPHLVDEADWHLGHDLFDRSIIRGPQCPASNLRDAGRLPELPADPV